MADMNFQIHAGVDGAQQAADALKKVADQQTQVADATGAGAEIGGLGAIALALQSISLLKPRFSLSWTNSRFSRVPVRTVFEDRSNRHRNESFPASKDSSSAKILKALNSPGRRPSL